MKDQKNILAFHLYNDFSGSPKVLKSVLNGLTDKGYNVKLLTSKNGILDNITANPNVTVKEIPYKFHANSKLKTIFNFLYANLRYFGYILFSSQPEKTVVFANTIMPVGAALGAKIRHHKLIYHYHENAFIKGKIYRMLTRIMEKVADRIICVSKTQAQNLKRSDNVFIIPNSLEPGFLTAVSPDPERAFNRKNVLMLSSLKRFKGVNEFCILAKMMPQYDFTLVLSDSEENCEKFKQTNHCQTIPNLSIFSRSENVALFYNDASVVLNLSDKRQVIETFGLTILEGMAAGLPVIVPTVGGPAEMVKDGVNGFLADVENLDLIKEKLDYIFSSFDIYADMSRNAYNSVKDYTEAAMIEKIEKIIER